MEKKTEDLVHEIKSSASIKNYLDNNESECINIDLDAYLGDLIKKKGLGRKYIFNRGNIAKNYGYHLLSGRKKSPSRDMMIKFCLGLELNIDEAQQLLRISRLGSLYARDKRDSVIMFCLENQKTALECDLLLDEMNLPALASSTAE